MCYFFRTSFHSFSVSFFYSVNMCLRYLLFYFSFLWERFFHNYFVLLLCFFKSYLLLFTDESQTFQLVARQVMTTKSVNNLLLCT